MNPISIPPIAMATLVFYVGFYHFLIYRRQKENRENLTFALTCFTVGLYAFCCAGLYNVSSPEVGVEWQRLQGSVLAIFCISLLWFINDYTGHTNKKIVIGFTVYYIFAALTGLLIRSDLTWSSVPSIKEVWLPFGYNIIYNEMEPGTLISFQSIVGLFYFIYIITVGIRFYRSGNKKKGSPLLIAIAILCAGLINDTSISSGLYDFIYMLEYSYIGMILVFTFFLTTKVIKAGEIKTALRESENRFRDISLSMADWIWETDGEAKFTYISQSIKDVLGYTPEELIGKTPFDFMPEDESVRVKEIVSKIISKSENIKDLENWNIDKEGHRFFMLTSGIPILDSEGKTQGYRGVNKNITTQRKLETQLQQSQKMESIGTLAGGIAHDFNNILFPIVGYSEMLLEDISEESPYRDSLNKIYKSSLRAKDLVNQILTFSRQETNELKLIKVQSIIKDALKLMRSTIPTTIKIKSYIKTDCRAIKADPTQIHQIVMNLTTNAYHAMEENGGELKVNFKEIELGEQDLTDLELKPGIYNCLIVADTGVGMDKDLTDKIFDPFFTTKKQGKGTGMGLSVVHGIVKNMDGAIHVYSEPGKGTEFHVYLPLGDPEKKQQETNVGMSIQGGTEHILLVDDEEVILTMGTKILERLGYQVTFFTQSIEALEAFSANPDGFDLIITDMTMPNLSGDKLSTELIKIRSDIPILLCTGFSENISERKAAALGIKGFLFKPIIMKELAQKIREVLDGYKVLK